MQNSNYLINDILLFLMIALIVFFIALSIRIRIPEHHQKGHTHSAPDNPQIGKRLLITLLISLVLWALTKYVLLPYFVYQ